MNSPVPGRTAIARGYRRLWATRRREDLAAIAARHGLATDPDRLGAWERALQARGEALRHLVLIAGGDNGDRPLALANALGERFPTARVQLLDLATREASTGIERRPRVRRRRVTGLEPAAELLAQLPRPDALLDLAAGSRWSAAEGLRALLFYVEPQGCFLTGPLPDPIVEFGTVDEDEVALAAAVAHVQRDGPVTVVHKAGRHLVKLRDAEATRALSARHGDRWGSVASVIPATRFRSRATLHSNRDDVAARVCPAVFNVPDLSLRDYRNVRARLGQVLFTDEHYLPDTFRHPRQARLRNRNVPDASPRFAELPADPHPERVVPEPHYFLDSEWPGHFGHMSGEVISRLPGFFRARERIGDLRVMIGSHAPDGALPGFQRAILAAAGIAESDITVVGPGETVRFERLIASTPYYANSKRRWVSPEIEPTWRLLSERLVTGSGGPAKLFISRRGVKRACRNVEAIDDLFRAAGFAIVYPEDLPFAEQVDLFAHAEVIAGFGGSGMFNAIYARHPGVRIVIASANFTCNEYLISAVQGGEIHCFWQEPLTAHPEAGWSRAAYMSDFEFDFANDGPALSRLLDSL